MNFAMIDQFNQLKGQRQSLIRKALDSSVGRTSLPTSPLTNEKLEEVITNTIVRMSPELAVIEPEYDPQQFHRFNKLTALPRAGGFMGEGATTPTRNSTYSKESVEMKILRRKGAVTNFLQDASKGHIDAAAAEMENHLQAHTYDMIQGLEYGNAGANKYAFDGLDSLITTNRDNRAMGGVVPDSLDFLDDLIDINLEKQGAQHKKALVMSPKMQSLVSRLLTNVRLNQGSAGGMATVEIEGGWRLQAYRGIPILPVSSMAPKSKMGTVTGTADTDSGSIAAGMYYFRVAYIDYNGESEASDLVTVTVSATGKITLAWTAVDGAAYYKIYAGSSSTLQKLVAVVAGDTYDSTGAFAADVTGVVITTSPTTKNPTLTLSATSGVTDGPTASVTTETAEDYPLVASNSVRPERLILWDLDKYQGLGKVPFTNAGGDRFRGLVTMNPLAVTDDNLPFMIRSYLALCPSFEATSCMIRGLRVK